MFAPQPTSSRRPLTCGNTAFRRLRASCFAERVMHSVFVSDRKDSGRGSEIYTRIRPPDNRGFDVVKSGFAPAATGATEWAASSAGRAPRSQCGGQEFDPPAVHQISLAFHASYFPASRAVTLTRANQVLARTLVVFRRGYLSSIPRFQTGRPPNAKRNTTSASPLTITTATSLSGHTQGQSPG